MWRYIFLGLILLFMGCANKHEARCQRFRDGEFAIRGKNGIDDFYVVRQGAMQTEKNMKTGLTTEFGVEWTGNCEYRLTLVELDKPSGAKSGRLRKMPTDKFRNIPIDVSMVASGDKYYVVKCVKQGIGLVYTDTMWVID